MNAIPERPLQEPYMPDAPEISQEQIDERIAQILREAPLSPDEILCVSLTDPAQKAEYELAKAKFRGALEAFIEADKIGGFYVPMARGYAVAESVRQLARIALGEDVREELERGQ